jgi:tRNA-splicing ligase RtcB (3'-phosphate/5'-hydroxy nucleic acid ligase)
MIGPIGHGDAAISETKIKSWATDLDQRTAAQVTNTAAMPFVRGVRLMPDAHLGIGSTVGSVIATEGAIMPAAVGVDIGCGMIAARLNLTARQLPDDLTPLHRLIEAAIPAGLGKDHGRPMTDQALAALGDPMTTLTDRQMNTTACQFGTLTVTRTSTV